MSAKEIPLGPAASVTSMNLTKAVLIFVLLSGTYFFARLPGLDDYDSVQFATGGGSFDLWQHQPHPPGYPLGQLVQPPNVAIICGHHSRLAIAGIF
ncbi:MAG: hypothetical protein ACREIW_04215 [Chthoniobacterales bacterium]